MEHPRRKGCTTVQGTNFNLLYGRPGRVLRNNNDKSLDTQIGLCCRRFSAQSDISEVSLFLNLLI